MYDMKKCELLVPAGGEKQFIAAVENGADAVYVGGTLYNARIGAGNFTAEELEKAADYAHLRNVKLYVTMNTLMDDDELEAGVGFAEMLYERGVDALIIQDLGLAKRIRERMPDFPLHLSTQATVYNRRGLEAAAEVGFERAVLARELSLEQIRKCSLPPIIETEVFVHGALCMCYSGQCQLSRFIGGRSGNKGRCAQPCRLPYAGGGHKSYPLSPKDLCMIDRLGDLIEAGVKSLKVEGRMKSAEYVATVTGIYRKYIDEYYSAGSYCVSNEDKQALLQIFNRGGFTEGYLEGDPGEELMSGNLPKNQGIKIGFIKAAAKGGMLADVELKGPLEMGDIIEIHGRKMFSTRVTYLENLCGNSVRIGDMKEKVYPGDEVYRIISAAQVKKAESTFGGISFDAPPSSSGRKISVDMTFKGSLGIPAKLTVSCIGPDEEKVSVAAVCDEVVAQKAIKRATTDDEIAAQLLKTGNTTFAPGKVKVIQDGELFIPVSGINRLRREALAKLAEAKKNRYKRRLPDIGTVACADFDADKNDGVGDERDERFMEFYFYSVKEFIEADNSTIMENALRSGASMEEMRFLLPLRGMADNMLPLLLLEEKIRERIVPYISNVTAGAYDDWLEDNLHAAVELVRNFGNQIYVGNISWIEPLAKEGVKVLGDFGLNITNRHAEAVYRSLGMTGKGEMSLEKLAAGRGAFPLMITEHAMSDTVLIDRKGKKYRVDFDSQNHKTVIRSADGEIDWNAMSDLWKQTKNNIRIYV